MLTRLLNLIPPQLWVSLWDHDKIRSAALFDSLFFLCLTLPVLAPLSEGSNYNGMIVNERIFGYLSGSKSRLHSYNVHLAQCAVHTQGLWFQLRWLKLRVAPSIGQLVARNGLMAWSSYGQERSDLLGCNFPLWCWGMFLCEPAVGVCFLGWDLWLWSLDVCLVDCQWWWGIGQSSSCWQEGCHCRTCMKFTAVDWASSKRAAADLRESWCVQSCSCCPFCPFETRISMKANSCLPQQILKPHLFHISKGISHLSCTTHHASCSQTQIAKLLQVT